MTTSAVITRKIVVNGREVDKSLTKTASGVARLVEEVAPGNTNDTEMACSFPVTGLKWIYINATKAATLETNNSSSPDDTITLAANDPYEWHDGDNSVCLITTAVTTTFWSVSGADNATVDLEAGYDATP